MVFARAAAERSLATVTVRRVIGHDLRQLRQSELSWEAADASRFKGSVEVAQVKSDEGEGAASVAVRFAPAARTNWHSHPGGQVLWVISGSAIVATEDGGRVTASSGDVVVAPPDELHWHGATADGPMVHVSVTADEGAEWTSREVDDDQYEEPTH